jgi:hypothetical protein
MCAPPPTLSRLAVHPLLLGRLCEPNVKMGTPELYVRSTIVIYKSMLKTYLEARDGRCQPKHGTTYLCSCIWFWEQDSAQNLLAYMNKLMVPHSQG